jgi:sodium/potassium-transporting ATPase subunit alpha
MDKPAPRIRYAEDEERIGRERDPNRNRNLSRQSSTGSLSIHSAGGNRTVQPETALPITYRTL